MNLEKFTKEIVDELNAPGYDSHGVRNDSCTSLASKYLFKNEGEGQIWVGKWGNHGIKFTEFKIEIVRNHRE